MKKIHIFANMVFVLGVLFSILLIFFSIYKIYNPPALVSSVFYIITMLCGGVFALLFGFGLKRMTNNLKVNLSVLFFTVGTTLFAFEAYLGFHKIWNQNKLIHPGKPQSEIIAKQMGVPYDTRKYVKVLDDLKDSGVKAFPNVNPNFFIKTNGITTKKGRIFPLGTISNSTTILDNEAGYFPIIETDEHGFNNSKGLYIENKIDIVLTGDSFTEGYSVHQNESIGAVLRKLNFNAISVGKAGNGPLIELAALKEYAEPLKPKIVLWLYYMGDVGILEDETKSSILKKYLNEDDFSQHLITRQDEIDDALTYNISIQHQLTASDPLSVRSRVSLLNSVKQRNKDKERAKEKEKERINHWKNIRLRKMIINLLKLTELRKMISLTPATSSHTLNSRHIFRNILDKSKHMVLNWGGKIYFVYLPDFTRYSTGDEHPDRDFVMLIANELDIPIIDIHKEVFDPHLDPLSLFPFRVRGHYNAEGYRLVVEAIERRLEKDGYVPINSNN